MDKLALETSSPDMPVEQRRNRNSMIDPDLIVDARTPRKDRNPHCWLFTALFLFVVILGGIMIIHFRDEITGRSGVPLELDTDTEANKTYYFNVESGLMGHKQISGAEASILNLLASQNSTKIEKYLGELGIVAASERARGKTQLNGMLKGSSEPLSELSFLAGVSGRVEGSSNSTQNFFAILPYIVQLLGGPTSEAVQAIIWLVNTAELKPLMIKYFGADFFTTLMAILDGTITPSAAPTADPTEAPDKVLLNEVGFQQLGSPDLIVSVQESLIKPETAAELQGLLFS